MADKPKNDGEQVLQAALGIVGEYAGMQLTLRQIYYRLVAAQMLINRLSSYKFLGNILARAREDGSFPWDVMEDRTRRIYQQSDVAWDPAGYFNAYYDQLKNIDNRYSMPKWWGQAKRVFVVLEKEALLSVFQQVTDPETVDLVPLRGYSSVTLLKLLADRIQDKRDQDEVDEIHVVYFGDFDPSGINIEEKVQEKVREYGSDWESWQRIAITRGQIDEYNLPPAPAKTTDSRYEGFVAEQGVAWHGGSCDAASADPSLWCPCDTVHPRGKSVTLEDYIQALGQDLYAAAPIEVVPSEGQGVEHEKDNSGAGRRTGQVASHVPGRGGADEEHASGW